MTYYCIGGLGCNVYYPQDFFTALKLPIVYLDLYGLEIRQEADLEEWFALQVELNTFQYQAQLEPTLKDINLTIYEGEKVLIVG
ncbi:hypothetical protein PZH43_12105, partial [Streptococcus gordonii]|nr:hypothetical protein [Streptococcus gordonii]